jgi:hypothetical protein
MLDFLLALATIVNNMHITLLKEFINEGRALGPLHFLNENNIYNFKKNSKNVDLINDVSYKYAKSQRKSV